MNSSPSVLLSWIAVNNDPYERDPKSRVYQSANGKKIPGPTLTLLFDEESPYKDCVRDVIFFHRAGDLEKFALNETVSEIKRRNHRIQIDTERWTGDDPTDHH